MEGETGEHVLEVGGRPVRLLTLGPAHTAGDLVVHLPDAGVVYAGDLLFVRVTPVIWQGPVSGWVGALDRLLVLDAGTFVPGHGPLAGRRPAEVMRHLARDTDFGRFRGWHQPERYLC